jgi:hypothetical protein
MPLILTRISSKKSNFLLLDLNIIIKYIHVLFRVAVITTTLALALALALILKRDHPFF